MREERPELDGIRDALRDHDLRSGPRPTGQGGMGGALGADAPVRERLREHDEPGAAGFTGRGEGESCRTA